MFHFFKKQNKANQRTQKVITNVLASYGIKGASVVLQFLLIRFTLEYLTKTEYGIWLTLSSLLSWLTFFDIGLGNGLRNKLAEALANDEQVQAKSYVSTAYAVIGLFFSLIGIAIFASTYFIDWAIILNAKTGITTNIALIVAITFACFCLNFILQLINTILLADQKSAIADFNLFLGNLLITGLVFYIKGQPDGSLLTIALIHSVIPLIILLIASIYFFNGLYRSIAPSFTHVQIHYFKDLMGVGIKFFIMQIGIIILFFTDNLIIAHLFEPAQVVPYNIANKYFSLLSIGFLILTGPFWSAITEAYTLKDIAWIKKMVRRLIQFWIGGVVLSFVLLALSQPFYGFWLDEKISIPLSLSICNVLYIITFTWSNIFGVFLSGTGIIRLSMYLSIFESLLNIPLSIFLAKFMGLGITGVLLATVICMSFSCVIFPIQYLKIIRGQAKGIWIQT